MRKNEHRRAHDAEARFFFWRHCTSKECIELIKKDELLRLSGNLSPKYDGVLATKPMAPRGVWFQANSLDEDATPFPFPQQVQTEEDNIFYADSEPTLSYVLSIELPVLLPSLDHYDLSAPLVNLLWSSPPSDPPSQGHEPTTCYWVLFRISLTTGTSYRHVKYAAVVRHSPEYFWLKAHCKDDRDRVGVNHCWELPVEETFRSERKNLECITVEDEFATLMQYPSSIGSPVRWKAVNAQAAKVFVSVFVCPPHGCPIFVQPKMDSIDVMRRLPSDSAVAQRQPPGDADESDSTRDMRDFAWRMNVAYSSGIVPAYHKRATLARWHAWMEVLEDEGYVGIDCNTGRIKQPPKDKIFSLGETIAGKDVDPRPIVDEEEDEEFD